MHTHTYTHSHNHTHARTHAHTHTHIHAYSHTIYISFSLSLSLTLSLHDTHTFSLALRKRPHPRFFYFSPSHTFSRSVFMLPTISICVKYSVKLLMIYALHPLSLCMYIFKYINLLFSILLSFSLCLFPLS